MGMGEERTTQSFKVSPQILSAIIAGVLGAVGGGAGTAAYVQQQQPPAVNVITRDEFERRMLIFEKQLDRVERKLDEISARPVATSKR